MGQTNAREANVRAIKEREAVEALENASKEALAKYVDFRPTQVNRDIWAKRFILFVEDLTAVFDGFTAVDIPMLGIETGKVRVVIGPNGAGKTTFCDLVSGKTKPTTGRVFFDGVEITGKTESDIALMGIGRKFQTPTVFDSLTTYENLMLALPGNQGWRRNLFQSETKAEREKIHHILERVHLIEELDLPAKSL
ncbi:MAG: ATP-binding cassette domain-containing protein, partial [Opitutae bacterium]|nr:ATP-binding cassette domain-containing protein [Opitutae bacterium]